MTPYYFIFLISMIFSISNPLAPFQWKYRIVLLSGPEEIVKKQVKYYKDNLPEVLERDMLIIYEEKDDFKFLPKGNYPSISLSETKNYFDLSSEFKSLLIGKDGGIKSRDEKLLLNKSYFVKIDGMPMRRREMREKGDK